MPRKEAVQHKYKAKLQHEREETTEEAEERINGSEDYEGGKME